MPPKSATGKSGGIAKKRRGGPKNPEFADCLTKLRKEICPEVGCNAAAMHLMSDLISKFADRLIKKTGTLARYDNKGTMKAKHAQTAGNMILIGPLSAHAYEFANTSTNKFLGKPVEAA